MSEGKRAVGRGSNGSTILDRSRGCHGTGAGAWRIDLYHIHFSSKF